MSEEKEIVDIVFIVRSNEEHDIVAVCKYEDEAKAIKKKHKSYYYDVWCVQTENNSLLKEIDKKDLYSVGDRILTKGKDVCKILSSDDNARQGFDNVLYDVFFEKEGVKGYLLGVDILGVIVDYVPEEEGQENV